MASEANPCRLADTRVADDISKFHLFTYEGHDVQALRFSTPVMSIVLDLTSLAALGTDVPGYEG